MKEKQNVKLKEDQNESDQQKWGDIPEWIVEIPEWDIEIPEWEVDLLEWDIE